MSKKVGNDIKVGNIPKELSSTVNGDVYMDDPGLEIHVLKRHKHELKQDVLDNLCKYVKDIIADPDYVGHNPRYSNSIELVKKIGENYLVAIKVDKTGNQIYVATLHEINDNKIAKRLKSKRLRKV